MTMTSANYTEDHSGDGIYLCDAEVELMHVRIIQFSSAALCVERSPPGSRSMLVATKCNFTECGYGVFVANLNGTFTNCVIDNNEDMGLYANDSTIHLHGKATAIHSNTTEGIYIDGESKCLIHLPSHHNTSFNNGRQDRKTEGNGATANRKRRSTRTNINLV